MDGEKKNSSLQLTSVREEHVEHRDARPHPPVVLEQPRRRRLPVGLGDERRHHDAHREELRRRARRQQLAHVRQVSGLRQAQAEERDDEAEAPLGEVRGVARGVLECLRGREVEDDAAVDSLRGEGRKEYEKRKERKA